MVHDNIQNKFYPVHVKPIHQVSKIIFASWEIVAVIDIKDRIDGVEIQRPISVIAVRGFEINLAVNRSDP
ncbi:MAG: hypothetical protein A4E74_02318 [Syntrophus sp. PtaB.Bin075]|nr:MAG: hypothetical protein A4E74_02318 [Syntrophus sp. PtaB.Bin075]